LGVDVPKPEALDDANQKALGRLMEKIKEDTPVNILQLPINQNRRHQLTLHLCSLLDPPSYASGNFAMYLFVSTKAPEISLKYGNTAASCKTYCNLGALLGGALNEYDLGYRLGYSAYQLSKKLGHKGMQCQTALIVSNWLQQWNKPLKRGKKYNVEGLQIGLEGGEIQMVTGHTFGYICNIFGEGQNLDFIKKELEDKYWKIALKYKNAVSNHLLMAVIWAINDLNGENNQYIEIYGEKLGEAEFEQHCLEHQIVMALISYYVYKIQISFILEKPEEAIQFFEKSKPFVTVLMNFTPLMDYNFYTSLLAISEYQNTQKEEYLELLKNNQIQMQTWVKNCPENFLHKYQLVQAEEARIEGKPFNEVIQFYKSAIENAQTNEFIQDAALASELYAKYLFAVGEDMFAYPYLKQAYRLYKQWGATAKQIQMKGKYTKLRKRKKSTVQTQMGWDDTTLASTASTTQHSFDVETILRANMSLSQQVRLKNLIAEMLHLLTENAGANKVTFLRKEAQMWLVEADQENGQNRIEKPTLFEDYPNLPRQVISYVLRSKKFVLSDDISQDATFLKDPYVQKSQTKSVLIVPVQRQEEIIALLYLENSLNTGVFHQKRYELVNALSTQLAISMENTLLYENLEHKVQERTQQLQESNEELQVMNEELQQTQEELTAQRDLLALNNHELEEYQYRISKSIESALLIQTSILPVVELFEQHFAQHFILYLPKDVVSGDFYWLHVFENQTKILIEADCTGHGVPGAFMTLIGYSIINQVIRVEGKMTPVEIMEGLHQQIQKSLQQKATGNLTGMDLSILVIEPENAEMWKVTFGGSGQKLCYMQPDGELHTIKGSRRKIGGFSAKSKVFEENQIFLSEATTLYLSSDGFIDQNNLERQKFGSKPFEKLLQGIQNIPLAEQKKKLENTLHLHQQDEPQRDDITIIGIQL